MTPDAPKCNRCGQVMAFHSLRYDGCPHMKRMPVLSDEGDDA